MVWASISLALYIIDKDLITKILPAAYWLLFSYLQHKAWMQLQYRLQQVLAPTLCRYFVFLVWRLRAQFVWIWSECIYSEGQGWSWTHSLKSSRISHYYDIFQWLSFGFFTSSERELSDIRHHIGLIQNDELQITVANSTNKYLERAIVSANFLIYSRTTPIPRSSLAFSYITILLKSLP